MNLGTTRDRIRLLIPEASQVANADINTLINDGCLDVALKTECLENYADQTITADQQEYSVPGDCIKILSVYYGGSGNWEKLSCVTQDHMAYNVKEDWINDTGTTYGYYLRGDKIGIYKIPTSSEAGTNYLRVYYVEQPDALVSDSDALLNNKVNLYPYHELVLLFAMYKVKQILGKWEQSKVIESDYLMKCARAKIDLHRLDDFQQVIRPYYKGATGSSLKQNPLDQ